MTHPCGGCRSSGSSEWTLPRMTSRCHATSRRTCCGCLVGCCSPAATVTPLTRGSSRTPGPSPTRRPPRSARVRPYLLPPIAACAMCASGRGRTPSSRGVLSYCCCGHSSALASDSPCWMTALRTGWRCTTQTRWTGRQWALFGTGDGYSSRTCR